MIYYLGLGSNIGDLNKNLNNAIDMISKFRKTKVLQVSDFIVSKAWGNTEQADFLNAVIKIETIFNPEDLLDLCKNAELMLGRQTSFKWAPRIIDIDILLAYDNDRAIIVDINDQKNEFSLKIPHPYISQRDFVLKPLIQLTQNLIHPLINKTMEFLLKELVEKNKLEENFMSVDTLKNDLGVIILAAGKGTRMKSEKAKVCFDLAGKSLVQRVVDTSLKVDAGLIGVVVGFKKESVISSVKPHPAIKYIEQDVQNGTGHAVKCCKETFRDFDGNVFILCGDVPLLRAETLEELLSFHQSKKAVCTVLTMVLDKPDKYGRIVRENITSGKVKEIVEFKDASEEIRAIKEVNSGIYCFNSKELFSALEKINNNNAQNEYYLTDVIKIFYNENKLVESIVLSDVNEAAGVNSQLQLAELEAEFYKNINTFWLNNGVTIENPSTVMIHEDVKIENDVVISANTKLMGKVFIGKNSFIGVNSLIHNSDIPENSVLKGYNILINYKDDRNLSLNLDWTEKKINE